MLDVCAQLFERFHDEKIEYCHWKSNEHLAEGLTGVTDLDVIVSPHQSIEGILAEQGFKRFDTAWFVDHPGLADYLGYDRETGRLVHLHLHSKLAIGNKRLKHYTVPWTEQILERRVFDEEHDVYRADPAMELLLLFVRYALKIQLRDYPKSVTGEYLGVAERREYQWLQKRTSRQAVEVLAKRLLNTEAGNIVGEMFGGELGIWQFRKLRKHCVRAFAEVRTYGPVETKVRGLARETFLGARKLNTRLVNSPRLARRTVPGGGLTVVFLGVDGAGKSTVVGKLDDWLSWKLDVQRVYFGSGDGPATLLRYPFKIARRHIDTGNNVTSTEGQSDQSPLLRAGRFLRGLVLARERKQKLRKAKQANNRGLVVLGDRYPQNQIMGFNDGPLLTEHLDASLRAVRFFANWEQDVYRAAEEYPPDLVIVLDVPPEVAYQRKPEMPLEQLKRRKAAIDGLSFDCEKHVIDATQPIEQVLREIKEIIWQRL